MKEFKQEIGSSNPFLLPIKATEVLQDIQDDDYPVATTAYFPFVIISIKNHPPKFKTDYLVGFIEENSQTMTAVRWEPGSVPQVIDEDSGLNGSFILKLEDDDDIFTIQPSKGFNELTFGIFLRNESVLDYENIEPKFFKFVVINFY